MALLVGFFSADKSHWLKRPKNGRNACKSTSKTYANAAWQHCAGGHCAPAAIPYFESKSSEHPEVGASKVGIKSMAQMYSGRILSAGRATAMVSSVGDRVRRYRTFRTTLNELRALPREELEDLGMSYATIRAHAYRAAYDA